jgi:hypothetical protein
MAQAADAATEAQSAHPFYDRVVDEAELREALAVEGLDQEIALLRSKLRDHLAAHPESLALMLKSVTLIVRAVSARYRISEKRAADLGAALAATVEGISNQFA